MVWLKGRSHVAGVTDRVDSGSGEALGVNLFAYGPLASLGEVDVQGLPHRPPSQPTATLAKYFKYCLITLDAWHKVSKAPFTHENVSPGWF